MDAPTIYSTTDRAQAEAACEQLRSHGIKCGSVDHLRPGPIELRHLIEFAPMAAFDESWSGQWDVVVAPEDAERATEVLRAWAGSESPEP